MSMKRVLCWAAFFWMVLTILSVPKPAFADGVYGVRETPTRLEVDVPKFCRPLKVVWEIRWEENATNKSAMLSFLHADNPNKVQSIGHDLGFANFQTTWSGAETVPIPRVDANGNRIKITLVSILAVGGGAKLQNNKNWVFIYSDGRVTDISPPVNAGTWGKCT